MTFEISTSALARRSSSPSPRRARRSSRRDRRPRPRSATALPLNLAPLSVPNTDVTLNDVEKSPHSSRSPPSTSGGPSASTPTNGQASPDYLHPDRPQGRRPLHDRGRLSGRCPGRQRERLLRHRASASTTPRATWSPSSDDQYEGTDSLLMDVTLPSQRHLLRIRVSSYRRQEAGDPRVRPREPDEPTQPDRTSRASSTP